MGRARDIIMGLPQERKFRTADGYLLHLIDGQWVDHPEPDKRDLTFDDREGLPVDQWGEPLDGKLV